MESFLVAVNAVVPFLCYITFGYVMKIKGVVKEDFLQQLNKMVFKVFYPFMTFYNIYKADASSLPRPVMLIFCGISILVLEVILVLTVPRLVKENPRRGVIIQAIYRSNFVLFGLPLTVSVFGDVASSVAAMVVTVVITIYNTTSVVILEMFNSEGKTDVKTILTAGASGIVLGLISAATAVIFFFVINLLLPKKERNAMGAAIGTTALNSAMTPAAVAEADPSMAQYTSMATAQCATASIITLFLCPFITAAFDKWMQKRQKGIYSPEGWAYEKMAH